MLPFYSLLHNELIETETKHVKHVGFSDSDTGPFQQVLLDYEGVSRGSRVSLHFPTRQPASNVTSC